jgi:hypothetical protein
MKSLLLLFSFTALAEVPLDVTQSGAYPIYPTYIDHRCGALNVSQADDGLVAHLRVTTTCSTGGRGSKPRTYFVCTDITFAPDRYYILSAERVREGSWLAGQAPLLCQSV